MCIQWTRVLYSVVITRQSNSPISQFNSLCNEFLVNDRIQYIDNTWLVDTYFCSTLISKIREHIPKIKCLTNCNHFLCIYVCRISFSGKNTAEYTCNDTRRAVSFDLYYTCNCPASWKGPYCETDVDECAIGLCPEWKICDNYPGSYDCYCAKHDIICQLSLKVWEFVLIIVLVLAAIIAVIVFCIVRKIKYVVAKCLFFYFYLYVSVKWSSFWWPWLQKLNIAVTMVMRCISFHLYVSCLDKLVQANNWNRFI